MRGAGGGIKSVRVSHLHGVFIILATEVGLAGHRNSWNRNAMESIVSTKQTENTGVCIFSQQTDTRGDNVLVAQHG